MSEDKKLSDTNTTDQSMVDTKPLTYYTTTTAPVDFRLAKKKDGTLILQGKFHMVQHTVGSYKEEHSYEWRDLETVELDD